MAELPGNLGRARGSIDIDISQLRAAGLQVRQQANRIGQDLEQGIGRGARRARMELVELSGPRAMRGLSQLGSAVRNLQGLFAVGLAIGAARAAISTAQLGVEARRAALAFDILSGSATQAQARIRAIQQASGNAVDQLQAIQIGTQAASLGLADTSAEFAQLTRAARAAALVSPVINDIGTAITELGLASANLSFRRLDQLGLSVTEVRDRMAELREEQPALDDSQRFLAASVELLNEKYGELLDQQELSATGFERLGAALRDTRREFGENIGLIDRLAGSLADSINRIRTQNQVIEILNRDTEAMTAKQRAVVTAMRAVIDASGGWLAITPDMIRELQSLTTAYFQAGEAAEQLADSTSRMERAQESAREVIRRTRAEQEARDQLNAGVRDERTQRTRELALGIADANRRFARDQADALEEFGRTRAETIAQFERQIARDAEDFSRQRARDQADLQRQIEIIEGEAAARRIDMRDQLHERLVEIDERFHRDMQRAQRDHRDNLLTAASRLDARAVFEEQRRFNRQIEDLSTARDDQVIREREAVEEQLAVQQQATEQRIAALRDENQRRLAIEDEDRAIRQARQLEDHERQLEVQQVAHGRRLSDLQAFHDEALRQQFGFQQTSLLMWREALQMATGGFGLGAPPQSSVTTNRSTQINIGDGAIQVNGGGGNDVGVAVRREMLVMLETLGQ